MHGLVRQFAADKLAGRAPAIGQAFVAHFLAFARAHHAQYDRLQPEWHNFAAAVAKAHAHAAWRAVLDLVSTLDTAWLRQVRFGEMRAGLTLALEAAQAMGDQAVLARTRLRLGEIALEQGDLASAEFHLSAAANRYLRLEDSSGIAYADYLRGRVALERSQDKQALAYLTRAQRLFEEAGAWRDVAGTLNMIALCHMVLQPDFHAIRDDLRRAVAMQRDLPLSPTLVESLCFLGRVEGKLGDYAVAEAHLIEAAEAAAALSDLGRLAEVQFDRIVLCRRRGQIGEGLAIGYDCLGRFKRSGRVRWEALVMGQLAILHRLNGEPRRALPLLLESVRVFDEQGDPYEQARAWDQLAEVYAAMGDAACSARAREKVLALNAALDEPPTRFGKAGDQ